MPQLCQREATPRKGRESRQLLARLIVVCTKKDQGTLLATALLFFHGWLALSASLWLLSLRGKCPVMNWYIPPPSALPPSLPPSFFVSKSVLLRVWVLNAWRACWNDFWWWMWSLCFILRFMLYLVAFTLLFPFVFWWGAVIISSVIIVSTCSVLWHIN